MSTLDIQPEKKNMIKEDDLDKTIDQEAAKAKGEEYVEVIPAEELEKPEAPKDPRMEIAENREKRMEEQREPVDIKDEPKDEPKDDDLTKNEGQTLIKVNGAEKWVDNERIDKAGSVQAYQKEAAVQLGFQDNSKRSKILDKQQQDLDKQREEFAAQQDEAAKKSLPAEDVIEAEAPNLSSPDDLKTKDIAELIKIEHTALVDGEDDIATAAALERHERRGNTTIDQEQVVAEVTEKVAQTTEASERKRVLNNAQDAFYEAHPEVKADPRLLDMVDQETHQVMADNPELKTAGEIFEKAYKNISLWKGDKGKTSSLADKRAEKRQLKQPGASNGRVTSTPEPQQETKSEYIQRVRESRGLE